MVNFKKPKIFVPILIAMILSVGIIAFTPNAVAEYKRHSIPEITGTIIASNDIAENIAKERIHFIVATSVAENAVDNGQTIKGRLGVVQGYLVYKFGVIDSDNLVYKVIVDAGNGATLYTSEGKSVSELKKHGYGDKWSHDKGMKSYYADLTLEEREAMHSQFKEMKAAFDIISQEDKDAIKAHFIAMKEQFADLSDDEHAQKHSELKEKMQEFMQLTLDEKIVHLQEFADSVREN